MATLNKNLTIVSSDGQDLIKHSSYLDLIRLLDILYGTTSLNLFRWKQNLDGTYLFRLRTTDNRIWNQTFTLDNYENPTFTVATGANWRANEINSEIHTMQNLIVALTKIYQITTFEITWTTTN